MSISVVIPCYNRETTLARSIDSALAQTRKPDEIVIVDDGSDDRSTEVARGFGPIVRLIEQSNAGAAVARNQGIAAAQSDWIAFLDSDDEWHPQKLEIQLQAANRFPEASLVFCDTQVRNDERVLMPSRFALGGLDGTECERDELFSLYDRSLFRCMLTQSRVITSAVMVRNHLPELVFPEDIWGAEDWALWLSLAIRYQFASVDRVLVTMNQQGDNISGVKGRLFRNNLKVLEKLMRESELTDSELQEVHRVHKKRQIGALYHSLISGETADARDLLTKLNRPEIGHLRYAAYSVLSRMPPSLVRRLAKNRGGKHE